MDTDLDVDVDQERPTFACDLCTAEWASAAAADSCCRYD